LIIPILNYFDGAKKFAKTAASREEGTWEEKWGSCSSKDFLLPGVHSPDPHEGSSMVLGDVLDKTQFISVSALHVSKDAQLSPPWFNFSVPTMSGSHPGTR